jgi:hypothetical protein
MAQPTNTYDSYDAATNKEDLVDAIYMLDDSETPVLNKLDRVSAIATLHEWPEDSLAGAADQESSPNAVIEGDDVTADATTAETRLTNRSQLMDKAPRTTSTQEAVGKAGKDSQMAREMMKVSKELKKDIEKALLANNAAVAGNSSTAREMAGFPTFMAGNINKASDATAPAGDGTDAWTFGTARALNEAQLKDAIKQAWDDGGSPNMIIANSFNRQQMSKFSGGNTVTQDAEGRRLTATVRIYESDFGELVIQADRQARTSLVYVLDMEHLGLGVVQDFHTFDLQKSGHSDAKVLAWEGTLEVRNRDAHAIITDLTTS